MDGLLSTLFSSDEDELHVLDCMAYLMIFMALCTFFTLLFENVPYGRYATSKYGFPVNVKFAWFVQELPAFSVPLCLLLWTTPAKTSQMPNQILIAMYFCHYIHRSLIYPFLIRGGKATPVASFALAFVFCVYNGYMQVRYLSHYASYPDDWVSHPCFIGGCGLWLFGWLVNVYSDHILRNLRKPGETGYKVPRVERDSDCVAVERDSDFKFLDAHISEKLKWDTQVTHMVKKDQQLLPCLHRLPRLKKFSTWYQNCADIKRKALQRVVWRAQRIVGVKPPSLQGIYEKRCVAKAERIIKDNPHPGHNLLTWPGKRYPRIQSHTTRFLNSFHLATIRLLNKR